ncbi:gliding motility-associated-like protein [Spirosoma lacussanchae]|uniref:gliding motility-associated C-terminal domain-containing protein n=1 Tax=Spirosoma lacussanchae TaxID=1884249 RepID=UPI0011080CE4|nr:gliding motility-associated C-terminal domain-containing protein [Spirosoma lacussanchae]
MRLTLFVFVWILLILVPGSLWATHQVGGQIEMRSLGTVPGAYRIIVTNYMEAGRRADQQGGGTLGIFRKRDNGLMLSFTVSETGQRQPVIYANSVCADQRNLSFIVATFEATIQLDPATYSDPEGYYISYQTRNRNGSITNLVNPVQTGYTFYMEFPALVQGGRLFVNSSPRFPAINGEYICINEPFTFPFGGTDADGDELRYSMITPLNQKNGNGQGQGNIVAPAPYPDVTWAAGYSADNAIKASQPLRVNAQTGQLSVTATQLGLFVFAVRVEEFRNGVKIGEVRRDFQFLVVDCPPARTPEPTVQIVTRPGQQSTTICRSDSAVLEASFDPNWNYQWRRDGVNLSGATSATLAARATGLYTVVASTKNICSKVGNSEVLAVSVVGSDARLATAGHLCATTGSVSLSAESSETEVTYQWFRNGLPLAGQTVDSLRTSQPGRYWVVMTHKTLGCLSRTDTADVSRSAAVSAVVTSESGFNRLCPQATLSLRGSGGLTYSWQHNGQPVAGVTSAQYSISAVGSYVVTAEDIYGCQGVSAPISITPVPPITVLLDSLPAVCGPNAPAYSLQGKPAGGIYEGTGVAEDEFSPLRAGIGNHTITYTVKPAPECAGVVATRTAVVSPIPTIDLADSIITYKGNTFALTPGLTGNPNQFQWASGQYLDNANAASPTVQSIQSDITYTLYVANSSGCEARDTIHITVYGRVWVPEAFTPNGDGMNDTWDLPGIEAFPDAVVTVFNRWGEVIFRSDKGYKQPFDGTLNGNVLPPGLYAYTVYTVPEKPVLRGSLVIAR